MPQTPASPEEQKERLRIIVSEAVGETRKIGDVREPTIGAQVREGFKEVEAKVAELKEKYKGNEKKTIRVWYTDPATGREYSERVTVSELEQRVKAEKQQALAHGLESVQITQTIEEPRTSTAGDVIRSAKEAAQGGVFGTPDLTSKQQTELLDLVLAKRSLEQKVGPDFLTRVRTEPPANIYYYGENLQRRGQEFVEKNLIVADNPAGRFVKSAMATFAGGPGYLVKIIPGAVIGIKLVTHEPGVVLPAAAYTIAATAFTWKTQPIEETLGQVTGSYLTFKALEWGGRKLSGIKVPTPEQQLEGVPGYVERGKYVRGSLEEELTAPYKLTDISRGYEIYATAKGKMVSVPMMEYVYSREVPPSEAFTNIGVKMREFTRINTFLPPEYPPVYKVYGLPEAFVAGPTPEASLLFGQIKEYYGTELAGKMLEDYEKSGDVLGYAFKTIKTRGDKFAGVTPSYEAELSIGAGGKLSGEEFIMPPPLKQITTVTIGAGGKTITESRTIGIGAAPKEDLLADVDLGGGEVGPAGLVYPATNIFGAYPMGELTPRLGAGQIQVPKSAVMTKIMQGTAMKQAQSLKQSQLMKQAQSLNQGVAMKQALSLGQGLALKQGQVLKLGTDVKVGLDLKTGLALKQGLDLRLNMRLPTAGRGMSRSMGSAGGMRIRLPKARGGKGGRKTFWAFPDPFSAWQSELKYGKFTGPPQTRKLRGRYRREVLFNPLTPRFPTLEQLRASRKTKKKAKRGTGTRKKGLNKRWRLDLL